MYSGKSGCIREKAVVFGQSSCSILAKMVVFGEKWLYLSKNGCIWRKSGCIRAKVVVFGRMLLYSGESGCISVKSGCNRVKWLYSGKSDCNLGQNVCIIRAKVDVFGEKYVAILAKVVVAVAEVVVFGHKWL